MANHKNMRALKLTLLLVGSAVCAQAQSQTMESGKEKSDVSKEMLRGKVKTVSVTAFTVVRRDGKLKKGREIHSITKKYNDKGFLTESVSTEGYDTVQEHYIHFKAAKNIFKYDNNGVLVGQSTYNGNGVLEDSSSYTADSRGNRADKYKYKGDGKVEWNYSSEYDNHGNLTEKNDYYMGKLKNRHTYKYDDNQNITEETFYDSEGRMKLKEVFSYDAKRNVTEIVDYNHNGVFQSRYTYAYDTRGNQVEEREYTSEKSNRYKKIVNKYDKDNNIIEVTQYYENGKPAYVCKLDKLGNHISDITYSWDGKIQEKVTQKYVYDEKGNETENIRYDAKGKPAVKNKNIYTYDTEKNWFIKICYENDKPTRITERIIDYYQ